MYKQHSDVKLLKFKKIVLNIIENMQGQDVICLDISQKCHITNFMIFCTGQSNRHVISIVQDILYRIRNMNLRCYGVEGLQDGEWVLVDLGDIILHVMQHDTRKSYALEKLWS